MTKLLQNRNWVYAVSDLDVSMQVSDSIRKANAYRNKLCELELAKRARHDALLKKLAPEYYHICLMVENRETELQNVRDQIQAARVEQHTKTPKGINHLTIRATTLKSDLKAIRANRKTIKTAAYDNPVVKKAMADNAAQHKRDCKAAKDESGLYWATEAIVKQASGSFGTGAPPRFQRYDGTGQIAIQFQGGLDTDSMTDECNTLCYFGDFLT